MNGREKQAQATKQRILLSAKKLIEENGYDNVSVDQIVASCGIAKGTFYHHFKTKDEMITAICNTLYDDLREQIDQMQDMTYLKKLQRYITLWHREVSTYNLHIARQMIKVYTVPVDVGEYGGKVSQMEQGMQILEDYLNCAVSSGELSAKTPVDTIAKALMFSMQGSTIYHCKHDQDFNVMDWNTEFLAYVVDSLLAPYCQSNE